MVFKSLFVLFPLEYFVGSQLREKRGLVSSVFCCSFDCLTVNHEVVLDAVAKDSADDDQPHELGISFLYQLEKR